MTKVHGGFEAVKRPVGWGVLGTQRAGRRVWTLVVGAKQSQRLKMGQIRGERDPNPAS